MGNHLERLNEIAHEKSHNEAVERRKKKKEKKQAKESAGSHGDRQNEASESTALPDLNMVKEKMMQQFHRFVESLKGIRGGDPTPDLLESIPVEAYGSPTPLSSVAQVIIVSPTLASVVCYDPSLVKAVSKAIRDNLEANPFQDEDGAIRVPLPRPSLETRQQLSVQVHKRAEACRQQVRNLRRTSLDVIKQGMAGKLEGISKDDSFRSSQDLDKITEEIVQKITATEKEKQASIMQV